MEIESRSKRPSSDFSLTVSTIGGAFGDDRVLSVQSDTVTLTDHGRIRSIRRLDPEDDARIQELASTVVTLQMPESKRVPAVDGGSTTIDIVIDDQQNRIVLTAGEDAPESVWDLLDAVESLGRRG